MATDKVILSLFDYSGNWPRYYKESGYEVFQVDIKPGLDILELQPEDLPENIYGILAAPPCTHFSGSGAQYWKAKDEDGRTAEALALVDKVIDLVTLYNPVFWAIENPVGRLSKLRPELGKPWYFNPHKLSWHGAVLPNNRKKKDTPRKQGCGVISKDPIRKI